MFPLVLKACVGLAALDQGKEIHYHIRGIALDFDVYVTNALIDMYTKFQSIMKSTMIVSWYKFICLKLFPFKEDHSKRSQHT